MQQARAQSAKTRLQFSLMIVHLSASDVEIQRSLDALLCLFHFSKLQGIRIHSFPLLSLIIIAFACSLSFPPPPVSLRFSTILRWYRGAKWMVQAALCKARRRRNAHPPPQCRPLDRVSLWDLANSFCALLSLVQTLHAAFQ